MDPQKIRDSLSAVDEALAATKAAMMASANKYIYKGSLDEIGREQIEWCKQIDAARAQMLEAYREAR